MPHAMLLLAAALLAGPREDNPELDPRGAKPGQVAQWKAADGLPFEYRVPKGYDAERGANLTLVLHGNGLDHRWTFWNHPADEFRTDDIVVSPDGTTPHQGTGANEFLDGKTDVERLHKLLSELKSIWKVRQVFLYGHSQGSFFAFLYAGAHPEDVDGVCGHASGVWNGTRPPKGDRPLAVGFLHGTEDTNVPYAQSWYGRRWYREEEKHALVHLRTLFDWDHRPHWYQAQSVLAWCEGMTSTDPARVAASLDLLAKPDLPLGADWAALWAVADRLSRLEGASKEQQARGAALAKAVDAMAQDSVGAIAKGLGKKGKLDALAAGPWVGELIRALEELDGVPALEAFAKERAKELTSQRKAAEDALEQWWRLKETKPDEALEAARELLEQGFADARLPGVLEQCRKWIAADTVELKPKDEKAFLDQASLYDAGRKEGFADFTKRAAKVKLAP